MTKTTFESLAADPTSNRTERGTATLLPDPEPREVWCPIISVDDHVLEPPDLFEGRVPIRLRDEVPRLDHDDEGTPRWIVDGDALPIYTANGACGRPVNEWVTAPQRYDEFRPGVYDVHARVRDMDLNGVFASLNFPSMVWGFAGKVFASMSNADAGLASLRAYNNWMLDWCGHYPERFIPCQIPWLPDPSIAAEEVEANAERGFKAVSFSENPEGLGLPNLYTSHWDPFFAACEETGTVVNLHVGSSGGVQRPSSTSPIDVLVALFPVNGIFAVFDWIYARIPLRFPDLKIVLSEAGVSWVPMAIERLRRAYRQREGSMCWLPTDPDPVEVLHRNFWFTSIEDPSAFRLLDEIGVENVMVETDYPHRDSSWPDTQALMRNQLESLPDDVVRRICYENAADLYRHPKPPTDFER